MARASAGGRAGAGVKAGKVMLEDAVQVIR